MLYRFENCVLDVARRELRRDAVVRPIEPQVFDLLHFLIVNRERAVSRDELFKTVWQGRIVSDAVLGTRINAARKAIGDDGAQQRLIKTLRRAGFRFVGEVHEEKNGANVQITVLNEKLSVMVVPPTVDDEDNAHACAAKGIADDLTVALVHSRTFDVIDYISNTGHDRRSAGHAFGANYSIIFGLRKLGDQARLTVRLVDGKAGLHIWAGIYSLQQNTAFADQDAITAQIAAVTEPCILAAEASHQRKRPLEALDAAGCVTAGLALAKFRAPANYTAAESLLKRAIELNPHFTRAHSALAYIYGIQVLWGWKPRQRTIPLALEAADKAILLDELDPWAHLGRGWALMQTRRAEEAIGEYRKALAINPYFPIAHTCLALALSYLGRNEQAVAALDDRDRLNAPDVFAGQRLSARASVYACAENYAEAIRAARRSVQQAPDLVSGQQHLVVNRVAAGEIEQARAALRSLVSLRPDCSLSSIADSLPYVRDADVNRTLEAFHLLGLR